MLSMFRNISIRWKITASFALVFLVTVGLGSLSMQRLGALNDAADKLRSNNLPGVVELGELRDLMKTFHVIGQKEVLDQLIKGFGSENDGLDELITKYKAIREQHNAKIQPGEEAERFTRIDALVTKYVELSKTLSATVDAGKLTDAYEMLNSEKKIYDDLVELFNQDVDYSARQGFAVADAGNALYRSTLTVMGVVLVVAALITIGAGVSLVRGISVPLAHITGTMRRLAQGDTSIAIPGTDRHDELGAMAAAVAVFKDAALEKLRLEGETAEARQTADAIRNSSETERAAAAAQQASVVESLATSLSLLAAGDLTCHITNVFAPEYERLRADFNAAVTQLQDTVRVIASNTHAIQSGTSEIAQSADDLSRRTEQQAASLEETAAALDEITATVRKTADGAREAQLVVRGAQKGAQQSGQVVKDAISAMSAIEDSAGKISQIIGTIDEIAFQTNLLALNAGVEAARAGDAGRGFAVVASEVRALAQRSAQAAKEIKGLISSSSQKVGLGVTLVGDTGRYLLEIASHVTQISRVVDEIALSAEEQATGLVHVNTAINQMDQVTQQNAAMVEQSTAASHVLLKEAKDLMQLTGQFKVGDAGTGEAGAAPNIPSRMPPSPRPASQEPPPRAARPAGGGVARKAAANAVAQTAWEEF